MHSSAPEPESPITGEFFLNSDVELKPVAAFEPGLREQLGGTGGDVILSRHNTRIRSERIGEGAARFLGLFQDGRRIVEAIAEYSGGSGDPHELLADVLPFARKMIELGVLTPASDAPREHEELDWLEAHFPRLSQLQYLKRTEDSTVAAAVDDGRPVILKFYRGSDQFYRRLIRHESAVLDRLWEVGVPNVAAVLRLVVNSELIAIELERVGGITMSEFVASHHSTAQRGAVALNLVRAYSQVHGAGFLHGDVNPGNIVVGPDMSVTLIDFGGARHVSDTDKQPRTAAYLHLEPEAFIGHADGGTSLAPPSPRGEQYIVAALAFAALCGGTPIRLALELEEAKRQLQTVAPRTFRQFGIDWPDVEAVVARALAKAPEQRFDSMSAFESSLAEALAANPTPHHAGSPPDISCAGHAFGKMEVVEAFERHVATAKALWPAQAGSEARGVYGGDAGIAFAFARAAEITGRPELIFEADRQIHALRRFPRGPAGAEGEWPFAPLHTELGERFVAAMVARQLCREKEYAAELDKMVASLGDLAAVKASDRLLTTEHLLDATCGVAGILVAACAVVSTFPELDEAKRRRLLVQAGALAPRIEAAVESSLVGEDDHGRVYLGMAHGVAGALLALIRHSRLADGAARPRLAVLLASLAGRGCEDGEGMWWPRTTPGPKDESPWTGWCHGSAGHLMLHLAAYEAFDDDSHLDTAGRAAAHIWMNHGKSGPSLCCGLAGEALALAKLGAAAGSQTWRRRAEELFRLASEQASRPHLPRTLFKGQAGLLLVAAELQEAAPGELPLFPGR